MAKLKEIFLSAYKKKSATAFTGRPEGQEARKEMNLDKLDNSDEQVIFIIPKETTSINPSFYLGLLFKSYIRLGEEAYIKKYQFQFATDIPEITTALKNDLEAGLEKCRIYSKFDSIFDELDSID